MGKNWYVLWAKPRREEVVASYLEGRGMEAFFPKIRSRKEPWTGRLEPLFSCYLFFRMDVDSKETLVARSAPGVRYVLGSGGRPMPLPDGVILAIQERLERETNPSLQRQFRPGQRLVIGAGPFKDLEVIFDRCLSASGRARVFIHMVGKLWSVQVNSAYLREVN